MKKILIIAAVISAFALSSCHREGFPSGEMTSEQLKLNPASAEYMTLGNYAMYKQPMAYGSEQKEWPTVKNTFLRHYLFMTEFRGDNFALCYPTIDELTYAVTYSDSPGLINLSYVWWAGYRIIYGTNAVIESLQEGTSTTNDHMLGENYFLRAIAHLHLVTLYATPYSHGADKPGIVIRNSTDTSVTERATVGKVYEQIVKDLEEAIRLMGKSSAPRVASKGFASKAAAQGLLSRVYLHMGRNDEVIKLVTEDMLAGATPASKLHTDIVNYYPNTLTSVETLWAVALRSQDIVDQGAMPASMYYKSNGQGWGEIYYSDLLLDLFNRYPEDKRLGLCETNLRLTEDDMEIRYDVKNSETIYYPSTAIAVWDANEDGGKYYFTSGGNKVWLETETVNGYPQNYIMLGGVKTRARLSPAITMNGTGPVPFPEFYMTKFSKQDGNPMLGSPAMIRWAEVILNRAEAYAKENEEQKALDDVNVIRTRAGLPSEAMFTLANYTERGYSSVLDVVLDERRMELCFEGFRAIDQFRNNKPIDRRYAGAQNYEVIQPTDSRFPYMIPDSEIRASGIPQNIR
jgi:hypothetical protein